MPFARTLMVALTLCGLANVPPPAASSSDAGPPSPRALDLHVVVESERTTMAAVRRTSIEYWLSSNKTWLRAGDRTTIVRNDLGVQWRLHRPSRSYSEDRVLPYTAGGRTVPPGSAPVNLHTEGFSYEPDFRWTVEETDERDFIAGRPCSLIVAVGRADFAETVLRIWLGPWIEDPTDPNVNTMIANRGLSNSAITFLARTAAIGRRGALMAVEEAYEPAILAAVNVRTRVLTLEKAPAPPDIYDLPDGFTREVR
jgi:hypothetical protein